MTTNLRTSEQSSVHLREKLAEIDCNHEFYVTFHIPLVYKKKGCLFNQAVCIWYSLLKHLRGFEMASQTNSFREKIEIKICLMGFSLIMLISICVWTDNMSPKAFSELLDVNVRHASIDGNYLALSLLYICRHVEI